MTEITTLREFLEWQANSMRGVQPIPEGYHYNGIADFVADRGNVAVSVALTDEERAIVDQAIVACDHDFQIKQCFLNAQWVVLHDASGTLRYVEGFGQGKAPIPVHHAWIEINGKVIDLTFRTDNDLYTDTLDNRVFGEFPEGWSYMGVPYARDELANHLPLDTTGRSLLDNWRDDWPMFRLERLKEPDA